MAPEVTGGVLPAPHGLGALGVQARVGPEDAEQAVRSREEVGVAPVVPGVVEHPVPFLLEEAVTQAHLVEAEGAHHPSGPGRCQGLGQRSFPGHAAQVGEEGGAGGDGAGGLEKGPAIEAVLAHEASFPATRDRSSRSLFINDPRSPRAPATAPNESWSSMYIP